MNREATGSDRRLLVVTYHFPPGTGVGGLRWAGLSRHLGRLGWDVRIISAFASDPAEFAPSVRVEHAPPGTTAAQRYQRWRIRRSNGRDGQRDGMPAGFRPAPVERPGPLRKALRTVVSPILAWPDTGRGWIGSALRRTRAVIQDFRPDVIVSSGPPHSAHVVTRLALGRSRIPWYMDFRDPWVGHEGTTPLDGWLEDLTIRRATGLIVTTEEFRELLGRRYPHRPVSHLSNGVDLETLPARDEPPFSGLAVTHLGSLYLERDPSPVLEAFERFLAQCPEAARDGSTLRFVGDGDHPLLRRVAEAAADPARRIQLCPLRPRSEGLRILARSSLALVLAQGQGPMVPAKLYESVGMEIPTLVVAEPGSATARESERLGALCVSPDDIPAMVSIFHAVWSGAVTSPRPKAGTALDHADLARRANELLNGKRGGR